MKRETITAGIFSLKHILILSSLIIFIFPVFGAPSFRIESSKSLDYDRPPRLEEEDSLNGRVFQFQTGLEIVCDIEYVKVHIFDIDSGRTPYENNTLSTGYTRIRLEKPGYEDLSIWVNIRDGYRTTVFVNYLTEKEVTSEKPSENELMARVSGPVYSSINPGDPSYYRQLYTLNPSDSDAHKSASIMNTDQKYIASLFPDTNKFPFVFSWDGTDTLNHIQPSGEYRVQMIPGTRYSIELTRAYTRKPLSYWSGSAGYLLSPTAQLIFPGGFQFGSTISYQNLWDTTNNGVPISFFFRLSPLKRWEAAFETELAFINEAGTPSIRLNTSQKVQILGQDLFQLALGLKGSYTSSINDFSDRVSSTIIRDPGGFSFFVPCQFDLNKWDLVVTPEFLYTVDPLPATGNRGNGDFLSVLRWGVAYSEDYFGATLSAALFIPFTAKKKIVTQVGVEGYLYIPDSPMYISLFFLNQGVEEQKENEHLGGYAGGLHLGFLF